MADPLSVGSGIITLVCACTAIGKYTVRFIGALRDAPLELVMLSNEVNDLNAILNEINPASLDGQITVSSTQRTALSENAGIITQLGYLKEEIIKLDAFVRSLRKHSPENGSVEIDRIGWARKRKTGSKLQRRLAEIKNKLNMLLHMSTA